VKYDYAGEGKALQCIMRSVLLKCRFCWYKQKSCILSSGQSRKNEFCSYWRKCMSDEEYDWRNCHNL